MTRLFSLRLAINGFVNRLAIATVCMGLVSVACADPIPVDNFSFEQADLPGTGGQNWTDCIDIACDDGITDPEYWIDDPLNANSAFAEVIANFSSDGTHHVGVQSGQVITQDLGVSLVANRTYTLEVGVGNRSGFTDTTNESLFGFTVGGVGVGGASVNASELAANTFGNYSFVYRTDASPPAGSLGVYLASGLTNRAHFDNVRVDVSTTGLGDVNGDGSVNAADFEIIRMNFLQSATSRMDGDLDGDGIVGLPDFREWKAASGGGAGSTSLIPEPSVLVLAVVAGLGLLLQRGRARVACTLALLAGCLCIASPGYAVPIPVDNFSFEEAVFPDTGGGTWSNCLDVACPGGTPDAPDPDYWLSDPNNGGQAFVELIAGFAADGANHLGVEAGNIVTQDLGVPYMASQQYTVTLGIGHRSGFTDANNQTVVGFLDDSGTRLATGTFNSSEIAEGMFEERSFNLPVGISPPSGNVTLFLGSDGGNRGHFDNVRVDFNPIVVGDVNNDGVADGQDFAVIAGNFNQSATMLSDGDIDGDGVVSWTDFKIWKANATGGSASALNIPEPSGLFLAATILCGVGGFRIRRRTAL